MLRFKTQDIHCLCNIDLVIAEILNVFDVESNFLAKFFLDRRFDQIRDLAYGIISRGNIEDSRDFWSRLNSSNVCVGCIF